MSLSGSFVGALWDYCKLTTDEIFGCENKNSLIYCLLLKWGAGHEDKAL